MMFAQNTAPGTIMVKIIEPPQRGPVGELADVLVGAFGITGAIVIAALVFGGVMGGVLYFVRSKRGL